MQLDKALYGCVEAAALWYNDLRGTITKDGFVENAYDQCVFNKKCTDGNQTTIVLHVDDLLVTNVNESNLDAFYSYLKGVYNETRIVRGKVLDYVGMSFDFTTVPGEVKVIASFRSSPSPRISLMQLARIRALPSHQHSSLLDL